MMTIYLVAVHVMNDTVTMQTDYSAFSCPLVAEAARRKCIERNKESGLNVRVDEVKAVPFYEEAEEVPILQD